MTTDVRTTRRAAIATMAGASLTAIAGPVAATPSRSASVPVAPPTWHGRELLRLLAEFRAEWAKAPLSDKDANATWDIIGNAKEVAAEIVARPVRTMSDIVDRAIVLTWLTAGQSELDHWWEGDFAELAEPLVALGGVTVAQCSEWSDATAGDVTA